MSNAGRPGHASPGGGFGIPLDFIQGKCQSWASCQTIWAAEQKTAIRNGTWFAARAEHATAPWTRSRLRVYRDRNSEMILAYSAAAVMDVARLQCASVKRGSVWLSKALPRRAAFVAYAAAVEAAAVRSNYVDRILKGAKSGDLPCRRRPSSSL
jgi:hypothetical protein